MSKPLRVMAIAGLGLWIRGAAIGQHREPRPGDEIRPGRVTSTARIPEPLLAASARPEFGTQDDVVTVISAAQFAFDHLQYDYPTLSGYCSYGCPSGYHLYQQVEVPAGAVIDYIGVNTATTGDAVMGFTLHFRDHLGGTAQLVSASLPAHGSFGTDYFGPLGILVPSNLDRVFILDLEQAPLAQGSDQQFFGYFEVWWHRVVSDPPATPTFGDVPASHPFYQYVEALAKSGITAGCAPGSYCPDAPLTRGQMAVFLSKALGLHWPN
jgi:hypothetical protein